jgi:hypothetical protein
MFRPAFVAIVRLQSSSVKSLYNTLKGRLVKRSQSSENYNAYSTLHTVLHIMYTRFIRLDCSFQMTEISSSTYL